MASVLITGTSKGIGFESTLAFGRAGHKVYATMRNPLAVSGTRARRCPRKTADYRLGDGCELRPVSKRRYRSHPLKDGPIDVLVNNAGIERAGSVEELPLAEFRAVMETSYFGALRCI